jgi:bifunctional enzyme CysN/CysC
MNNIYNIVTCGDVDSGKSTLLGRILFNTGNIYVDQMSDVISASKKYSNDNRIEYGFLFDGLQSEREQQITIDVAHRYFNIKDVRFHLFDAPGHKQYLHNFIIGCIEADCAILMVDSTIGLTEQTHTHYNICKELLVDNIIVCITKVDLVSEDDVLLLKEDILSKFNDCKVFKTSAIENISTEELINYVYDLSLLKKSDNDFLLHVQRVIYKDSNRLIQGIKYGELQPNLKIYPTGLNCDIQTEMGEVLTYKLNTNVDVGRGSIVTNLQLSNSSKIKGKFVKFIDSTSTNLIFKYGTGCYDINNLNESELQLNQEIYFTTINDNKHLGYGIVIDNETKRNVGLFIIKNKKITPKCYWFTGLSGAGKTTLAKMFINSHAIKPILLDGDDVRNGLNSDLDLTEKGRTENIRRISELSKLLINQNQIVVVSCISKELEQRKMAKNIIGDEYVEIYVKSTDETRKKRDTKGLYKSNVKLLTNYQESDYSVIELETDNKTEVDSLMELNLKLEKWTDI